MLAPVFLYRGFFILKINLVVMLKWYYLSAMNKKTIVGGEELTKRFPLRTTETLFHDLYLESDESGKSINDILNGILLKRYNRKYLPSPAKKQLSKTKKA